MVAVDIGKKIEQLTTELTNIKGVVGTNDEIFVAEKIYERFNSLSYFKENPENLKYIAEVEQKLGRKSVIAVLNGKKGNSDKTVLLISHLDTVGISDYGDLKEYATKPEELMSKLKELSFSSDIENDLNSGDYLFGRGIFDMKCGVATLMVIMEEISNDIENFEGNLIFAACCDEEGNSSGMLSVVPQLVKLKEECNYDYLAVIDTDYMTQRYENDNNRYIYVGTVGKLMSSFYVVGKETHVGEPFKGIDPNQITSELVREFNLNVEYCDIADGEVSLPPITLRQQDLKKEYSVQIAKSSYMYLNFSTHSSTPEQVMEKMLKGATMSFERVIENLNEQYKKYVEASKFPYEPLPWEARTISFKDLYEKVKIEKGEELEERIAVLSERLQKDNDVDDRVFALKIVEEVHNMWSDKDPVIVIYFSPPYYPHIFVKGDTEKEQKLMSAVDKAIEVVDKNTVKKKFYPYISDLSYAAAPREKEAVESLKGNMPGFGTRYDLPLEDMQELNLPVVNIGPFGKDAHKFTERLEKEYSFEVAPKLVYETIMNLLK